MLLPLNLHPNSTCKALDRIEVDVARRNGQLNLIYIASGRITGLRIPASARPEHTDELWKHTCFEAFVRTPGAAEYCEFNFAPSTQWAAYRFTGYRDGMSVIAAIGDPGIVTQQDSDQLSLRATTHLDAAGFQSASTLRFAITAVIEETSGNRSFWSLRHGPGKPDFHHLDGFVLDLPAAERT